MSNKNYLTMIDEADIDTSSFIFQDKNEDELELDSYKVQKHQDKIMMNLKLLANIENIKDRYPYLYSILNVRTNLLVKMNLYSYENYINSNRSSTKGDLIFFCSNRFICDELSKLSTCNRNINILVTLGLIDKHKPPTHLLKDISYHYSIRTAEHLSIDIEDIREICYYSIPAYNVQRLERAERVAKKLKEGGFKPSCFCKEFLIRTFSITFANRVYLDDRGISDYSEYLHCCIEEFILREVENKGYTSKSEIIEYLKFNKPNPNIIDEEFGKSTRRTMIKRQFDISSPSIKKKHGLAYKRANTEVKERFGLDGFRFIIFKSN